MEYSSARYSRRIFKRVCNAVPFSLEKSASTGGSPEHAVPAMAASTQSVITSIYLNNATAGGAAASVTRYNGGRSPTTTPKYSSIFSSDGTILNKKTPGISPSSIPRNDSSMRVHHF